MIEREAKGVGKDPCVPEKIKSSQETKRQEEDAEAIGASLTPRLCPPNFTQASSHRYLLAKPWDFTRVCKLCNPSLFLL